MRSEFFDYNSINKKHDDFESGTQNIVNNTIAENKGGMIPPETLD